MKLIIIIIVLETRLQRIFWQPCFFENNRIFNERMQISEPKVYNFGTCVEIIFEICRMYL